MYFSLQIIFFYGSAFAFAILLSLCIILLAVSEPYPKLKRSRKEKIYIDAKGVPHPFPSINDASTISLSVIVPAYNEENRLPPMMDECLEYLENRAKSGDFTYEIIIVSDGSSDRTPNVANKYSAKLGTQKVRVLNLETNRGKGGAVRLGMQSARGSFLLFADADGATKFEDFAKLEKSLTDLINVDYLKQGKEAGEKYGIVIGSRAHLEDEAVASRSFFRTVLMYGFHFLVWLFTVRGIRDTQCGFKLFTRQAARVCFESIHVERWAFDVELLYIAQTLKIPIVEVAVNWTEIEGSKLTPVWSWLQMGKDLGFIYLRYLIGAWKIKAKFTRRKRN